ncbi:Glycerophosphodiester transporter GIT2 [Colletotrichum gloeosporioides]|uniref:Glycerophosphodiester transporter GIT2 n=1 Tax=Colletotrichum gloeosporioides TaxID=474922 RepID=A0A8H4CKD3_COLGL|nr:Glycerophosphodiester transporter GIT2 [Colletotrichum gloeosporioides]KAF3805555.1 Glycerophosphodiester transporter GIT2 [Colletotrichum gloeosporioides]
MSAEPTHDIDAPAKVPKNFAGSDKIATDDAKAAANVEKGEIDIMMEEPEKTYYSTVSVWLMVLFSGLAIGSDGYNAAVIGNVELLLAILYPDELTDTIYQRLSNAFLIGMIVGMLLFGVVVDQLGRKTGAVATTVLLVLGITLSTAASGTNPTGMFWMLIVARGIAGVGAGGEYPVSGAGAAEATDEDAKYRKRRGFMFAMLADLSSSLGYIWGALVPLLLLLCVGQQVSKYDIVWRTSFALGMAPPLLIFWFRMRMAVSTAYRKSAMRKQRTPYWLALKRYWRPLIGSASTWFLYNWISIPFGIFSSTIMSRANAGDSLVKTLGWGVVINCFYVPGPFIGGYLSDKIGRRQTMALGFTLQAILGFVLGGAMNPIQKVFPLFVVLYGIFLTLGEVGPGSTVVLTASECFPTSIRGQMMGLISAFSKAGAAIGTQVFTAILNSYTSDPSKGNQVAFLIGSGFAVLGAIIALFVIPDVSRRLNDDDEAWKKYLQENNWDAQWGDEVTRDPSGVIMNKAAS